MELSNSIGDRNSTIDDRLFEPEIEEEDDDFKSGRFISEINLYHHQEFI